MEKLISTEDRKSDCNSSDDESKYQPTLQNQDIGMHAESNQASHYESQYEKQLNLSGEQQWSQNELLDAFYAFNIRFNSHNFQEDFQIFLQEASSNYEIIRISVSYGYFSAIINVINVDSKNQLDQLPDKFSGSFGSIYKTTSNQLPVAIKAIKIAENKFSSAFRDSIKEYFLLMIASALKIGPALTKIFGFDVVVFRDCVCFSMQFCEMSNYAINTCLQQLRCKVHLLHQLHIVHLDIKPENIAFSPELREYVFIDFGLSRMIKEPIGSRTVTAFTGSFNFCSNQMLQLYITDGTGPIDLYYNDLCCLYKSIKNLSEMEAEISQEPYCLQMISQEYKQFQLLLRVKFAIFGLSYFHLISSPLLNKCKTFISKHKLELSRFVITLSKTVGLLEFYRNNLNNSEMIQESGHIFLDDEIIERKIVNDEKVGILFVDRFNAISSINDHYVRHLALERAETDILFDKMALSSCKLSLYMVALVRFINVKNLQNRFEDKLAACRIFSELHIKANFNNDIQLYKQTIRFIFKVALTRVCYESFEIFRHSIQTIAILEILNEEEFIACFQVILQMDFSLVMKLRLVFEFIVALQFVKEKYRKSYDYNKLVNIMMSKLSMFLTEAEYVEDSEEDQLVKRFKFITHKKLNIDGEMNLNFDEYTSAKITSYAVIYLHQQVLFYMAYNNLINQINRYSIVPENEFKFLITYVNRSSRDSHIFCYIHFLIYRVSYLMRKSQLCRSIYSIFHQQFHHFEEHTGFIIYYYDKLNSMKDVLSKKMMLERGQIPRGVLIEESSINFEEIFFILNSLIRSTEDFYLPFCSLLNIRATRSIKKCNELVVALYKQNKEKILCVNNFQHKNGREYHTSALKNQILTINQLFHYNIEPQQEKYKIIEQFMHRCIRAAETINCFQCKILAVIEVKFIQGNIMDREECFLMAVDLLVMHLKHNNLKAKIFPILLVLVEIWRNSPSIYQKYDMREFIYHLIGATQHFEKYLFDLRYYNIFLNIYIYIAQIYQEEQLANFIYKVLQAVSREKIDIYIDHFYLSITHLIDLNLEQRNTNGFMNYHRNVIKHLLTMDLKNNCYISLYFSCLLSIFVSNDMAAIMLQKIGLSINRVSKHAKTLILNRYYYHFAFYMAMPARKNEYLCQKHLKSSSDRYTFRVLLKWKLKKCAMKPQGFHKIKCLKMCILKYHEIAGNLIR